MKTKPLYILTTDGGDGSFSLQFTFDSDLIAKMQEAHDNGDTDYDSIGCAGGTFDHEVLTVPESCTEKSLGISLLTEDDVDYLGNKD